MTVYAVMQLGYMEGLFSSRDSAQDYADKKNQVGISGGKYAVFERLLDEESKLNAQIIHQYEYSVWMSDGSLYEKRNFSFLGQPQTDTDKNWAYVPGSPIGSYVSTISMEDAGEKAFYFWKKEKNKTK